MKPGFIPFNKPFLTGNETRYIQESVASGKISGNGLFTKKCHDYFKVHYGFGKCLLTTSCTDALEMAAILLNLAPGDEVIMPSYTFVSTANAFVLRGAKIVFADSMVNHPNIDADQVEALITSRTKAIVPVHYAGVACDMDKILSIAKKYNLSVVEDAAQAIDSYYTNAKGEKIPLGSIGSLSAFSFHETKNIISGEGGMLAINDAKFESRAEIIWEKGTNRSAFFRGEVDKYGWVDIGSSFLPSDIIAAFLFAQLENMEKIQEKRKNIWNFYHENLTGIEQHGLAIRPTIPGYATNNAHMYYLVARDAETRDRIISQLKQNDIHAVFHYQSLHKSPFYANKHNGRELKNCDTYTDRLIRLPMYYNLTSVELEKIVSVLNALK
jgi:dTDP-4-amino-4,6-dideoxygalactose transaminase